MLNKLQIFYAIFLKFFCFNVHCMTTIAFTKVADVLQNTTNGKDVFLNKDDCILKYSLINFGSMGLNIP